MMMMMMITIIIVELDIAHNMSHYFRDSRSGEMHGAAGRRLDGDSLNLILQNAIRRFA